MRCNRASSSSSCWRTELPLTGVEDVDMTAILPDRRVAGYPGRPIVATMPDRVYVNCPLGIGPVNLAGPEAHHLATLLRAHPGDAVCLFNGDGAEYPAVVVEVTKKCVALNIMGRW